MRILFIYPAFNQIYDRDIQFGIAYISALLKKHKHKTELVYLSTKKDTKKIYQRLKLFKPDIVAFTSVSFLFKHIKKLAPEIKKRSKAFVICGGPHVTLKPEELEYTSGLDAICRGEGEYAMLELVNKMKKKQNIFSTRNFWFKKKGEIVKNKLRPLIDNLDKLPFPDRELFDYQKFINTSRDDYKRASFVFSRGCYFDCTYCSNSAYKKLYNSFDNWRFRIRSPQSCLAEVEKVTKKYDVKSLFFIDDNIALNKKWFNEFFSNYKNKLKYPFSCLTRVGTCDRAMFRLLKEAGCKKIFIGLESGDEWLRKKVMKRNMTNKQIVKTFKEAHEEGLKTLAFNMIGLPYETPARFMKTVKLNAKINPTQRVLAIFFPYPKTELGDLAEEKGWVDFSKNNECFVEREESILNMPQFTPKQIKYYLKNFEYLIAEQRIGRVRAFFVHKILKSPGFNKSCDLIQKTLKLPKGKLKIRGSILKLINY